MYRNTDRSLGKLFVIFAYFSFIPLKLNFSKRLISLCLSLRTVCLSLKTIILVL